MPHQQSQSHEPIQCPQSVLELIERFELHAETYRQQSYNETQVRREFIDPMFKALGWDMDNESGHAAAYKDVIHEDAIKVGGSTKAPDYCFRIGGVRKFFVEAKKPAISVGNDPGPAYQLRRYAWTNKLPLSIVTDFEEFAVYDCRIKPKPDDKPSVARVLLVKHTEYEKRWDEIASIFSKDAILKGSFDKYAESNKRKKGTAEVDDELLKEIESWRDKLAHNIALRNPNLSVRDLNYAVGKTIDRIIFLRMCEDRGVESYAQLRLLLNGPRVYPRLVEIFHGADQRYNSGLFHFEPEKNRHDEPDTLTPTLTIDDKVLKDIIKGLYYPDSPYEFSVMPPEILGQVYEQFLGKVIRLTKGHKAVVEEKPEVKKAGGVYYTPKYIVDYIVEHTVGKLLKEAGKPAKVEKLRILDPACGSGSFLLGAYQTLLDWHLRWYTDNDPASWAKKKSPPIYQSGSRGWQLTIAEKKRILLNNIYGVDIDAQAVEVTKLSLLLRVLEGESAETIGQTLRMFHERALPDLADNIKCGNSLIGPDFYNGHQLEMFDEEARYRINVFDWQAEFPDTMRNGGFDTIIGNPPYGAALSRAESDYLRLKYQSATRDLDSYALFMEQALRTVKLSGFVSMIVPTGWYSGAKFSALRRLVASQSDPLSFVNLPYDVFHAWVDTTVFLLARRTLPAAWPRTPQTWIRLLTFPKRHRIASAEEFDNGWSTANFTAWFAGGSDEYLTYADSDTTRILKKIQQCGRPLGEMADVQRGVTPFHVSPKPTHKTSRFAFTGTVRRYTIEHGPRGYIRFDHTLAEPKPERYFKGPRLLLRELISRQFRLQAVKVEQDLITNKSMQSILEVPGGPSLDYLLGMLNSRLISWYFLRLSNVGQRDDFPKTVLKETRAVPVPAVELSKRPDRTRHDRLVQLVRTMLSLQELLTAAKTPDAKTAIQRQIDATDRQIDQLVYELYGLTDDEIRIVEEATGRQ